MAGAPAGTKKGFSSAHTLRSPRSTCQARHSPLWAQLAIKNQSQTKLIKAMLQLSFLLPRQLQFMANCHSLNEGMETRKGVETRKEAETGRFPGSGGRSWGEGQLAVQPGQLTQQLQVSERPCLRKQQWMDPEETILEVTSSLHMNLYTGHMHQLTCLYSHEHMHAFAHTYQVHILEQSF